MKLTQKLEFKHSQIDRVLFYGVSPEVTIYPFRKSASEYVQRLSFTVGLHAMDERKSIVDKLTGIIREVKGCPVTTEDVHRTLSGMNSVVLQFIVSDVSRAYTAWQTYFQTELSTYVETSYSKFQWEIAQAIGIETLMKPPLSTEQRLWIAFASVTHKNVEKKFTLDLVDSLKPWFNIDLYQSMEKTRASKRTNVNYEAAREKMLNGSFGISTNDQRVIDRLERAAQTQAQAHITRAEHVDSNADADDDSDLDIIT